MTFTQLFTDSFTRANGSSLGNGWIDTNSTAAIASNLAVLTNPGSTASWNGSAMPLRPTSDGNPRDGQVVFSIPANESAISNASVYAGLRWQAPSPASSTTTSAGYLIGVNFSSGSIQAFPVTGGTLGTPTSMASANISGGYQSTHSYTLTASVVGVNPTVIAASLYDNTTSAVVASFTANETTATLQSLTSGVFGLLAFGATEKASSFTSYAALTASTAYTVTGPSSGAAGAASSAFTVASNGTLASAVTMTPSDGGAGGTFTPSTITLAANSSTTSSATFTYTPSSTGSKTLSFTNNGSLTNPSNLTYASTGTATAYTLTGPSSGITGTASTAFTVASNGTLASAVTVTPSDSSAGGTFTPTTVSLAAGSATSGSFTYAPSSIGAKTISTTNNGSLTNPASVTYTSTGASNTIGVTSTACLFSPGNWYGDTGRAGSVYRESWNNGAWVEFVWTAAASGATAVLNIPSNSSSNKISYFLNGVLTDNVAATGPVTITPVAGVVNTLKVYLRNSTQSNRWAIGATNTVQITGLTIDGGSTAGTAPAARPWAMIVGDSISEGTSAATASDDYLYDYSFLVAQALDQLGYDTCSSACGYSGFLMTGDGGGTSGDVPAYYYVSGGTYSESASRWDKIASGVSFLDTAGQLSSYGATGTSPSIIFINYGTNEALQSASTSDLQVAVQICITSLRTAAPNAYIFIQIPFGLQYTPRYPSQAYTTALLAGVAAYQAAVPGDTKITVLNFGATLAATIQNGIYINSDSVHPTQYGHALVAPMVASKIASILSITSNRSYNFF